MITSKYHVHVHSRIVHSIALLTVSSWESGAGMDLGPGAWGNLLKGAKALGLKNWRTKRALSTEFTLAHNETHRVTTHISLSPRPKPTSVWIASSIRTGVGLGLGPRLYKHMYMYTTPWHPGGT